VNRSKIDIEPWFNSENLKPKAKKIRAAGLALCKLANFFSQRLSTGLFRQVSLAVALAQFESIVVRRASRDFITVLLNWPWKSSYLGARVFTRWPVLDLNVFYGPTATQRLSRAVRRGLFAAPSGFTSKTLDENEMVEAYLRVHEQRNELEGLRPLPHFDTAGEEFTKIAVVLIDSKNSIVAFAYGVGFDEYMRFQVSVTSTNHLDLRYLLTQTFHEAAHLAGFRFVITDHTDKTSAGLAYYQRLWGYKTSNLVLTRF
jgi:hypothetical protein